MIIKTSKIDKMIKKVQKSLKLTSYNINWFLKENLENSVYAEITYDLPKRKAVIVFNKRKLTNSLKDTIIHELLHLFLYKHLGVAENVFERQKKFKSLKKYRAGEEKAIEILASLLKGSIFPEKERRS